MPEAAEFGQVEARIARMTDAELVEMDAHPDDYEPWALELGRAELARRKLAPTQVSELRAENARDAAEISGRRIRPGVFSIFRAVLAVGAVVVSLLLPVARSCGKDDSKDPSVMCAQQLAKTFGATAVANVVEIEGHTLATDAVVEDVRTSADGKRTTLGIAVTCRFDGRPLPALTSGMVAAEPTREAALTSAVEDWVTAYGRPIVEALTAKDGKVIRVGGYRAYAGPTGVRGSRPDNLGKLHEAFFREVGPALPRLLRETPVHALTAKIAWQSDAPSFTEFRVDGELSEPLKQVAMRVDWPRGQGPVMLVQYYVLTADGAR